MPLKINLPFKIDDLIGIEEQKEIVLKNTINFVSNKSFKFILY